MKLQIIQQRLINQHIACQKLTSPAGILRWMGAVQAQNTAGALWATGLRMVGVSEKEVEQSLEKGDIIHTWLVRGTLHLALPEDIGWMLGLVGNRNIAAAGPRFKQLGLDQETFHKSREAVINILKGGNRVSREDVLKWIEAAGIATTGQRGFHILWRLGQEGLICFGPRRGSGQTLVLLHEWVDVPDRSESRETWLERMVLRYFRSRGPATKQDFAWWSGLTLKDVEMGLVLASSSLNRMDIGGKTYWSVPGDKGGVRSDGAVYLLPAFDEYLISYKDRSQVLASQFASRVNAGGGMIKPSISVDGVIKGVWTRKFVKGKLVVSALWFDENGVQFDDGFQKAVQRYADFLGMPVSNQ